MGTLGHTPTLAPVSDGEAVQERRTRLGLSVSELARRAHVDRGRLTALEAGETVRDSTLGAVEHALDKLEQELGMNDPDTPSGVVRFVVRGVYGAEALVVEGPVENIAALEASVDRIMRRLRNGEDSDSP